MLMTELLTIENITVLSELPATNIPPKIDMLFLHHEEDGWTERQRALLPDGIRDSRVAHHVLELKITESVNEQSFRQAFTYDYLYQQSQKLGDRDLQTYIVSAKTPKKENMKRWGYTMGHYPGVYGSDIPVFRRVRLLLLNELRDTPYNNYFRLFASRKKIRESAFEFAAQEHKRELPLSGNEIWTVLFALQRAYELGGIKMSNTVTIDTLLEYGDQKRKEVGEQIRKNVFASASIEERLAVYRQSKSFHCLNHKRLLLGLG